jgi:hypothetical protein
MLLVLALAGGHASLLLRGVRDEDSDGVRALRGAVLTVIVVLCLMAIVEISSNGEDIDPEAFGVLAVLYLLGTLLLPLVRRVSGQAPPPARTAPELLRREGHVLVEGPVRRGGAHGHGENVCLREPDGTLVEVITYDR